MRDKVLDIKNRLQRISHVDPKDMVFDKMTSEMMPGWWGKGSDGKYHFVCQGFWSLTDAREMGRVRDLTDVKKR